MNLPRSRTSLQQKACCIIILLAGMKGFIRMIQHILFIKQYIFKLPLGVHKGLVGKVTGGHVSGFAALTLRKIPAQIEIINDIDNEIVNFFEQLRNNFDGLIAAIELTPYAEQELTNSRASIENLSAQERARRFLVQAMIAINGVFGEEKGGFSYSDSYTRNGHDARVNRWNNLPERLKLVVKRLKFVRIENKDARKLLSRYLNRPATLMYLDPPYLGDRTNGYNKDANDEQFHKELLNLANKAKCMIFISGYENNLYNTVLSEKKGGLRNKLRLPRKIPKVEAINAWRLFG